MYGANHSLQQGNGERRRTVGRPAPWGLTEVVADGYPLIFVVAGHFLVVEDRVPRRAGPSGGEAEGLVAQICVEGERRYVVVLLYGCQSIR